MSRRAAGWPVQTPARADGPGAPGAAVPLAAWRLLEQTVQHSPVGVAVIDRDGVVRIVNPAYCAVYGYRPDELLGSSFAMLCEPPQRDAVLAQHRQFLDGVGSPDREGEVVRRDGTRLNVLARSVRVSGEDGCPCRAVYVLDVTERRRIERALLASQKFSQSVLDGLGDQICVLDPAGTIVAVNRTWRDFAAANGGDVHALGEGARYLAVCDTAARTGAADAAEAGAFAALLRELLAGQRQRFELEYPCHAPAQQRWFSARAARIEDSDPPRFVVAHVDVTALKQAEEGLRQQATTDELTGVANRRHFLRALGVELERVRRHPGLHSSVLTLDADRFKRINDTRGHAAGDAVLRHITRLVTAMTRPIDVLGRMGGEEFALLLPDTSVEQAVAMATRLGRNIAEQPIPYAGHQIRVTVSMGVTGLAAADADVEAALRRADEALYEAKDAGRDTVRWQAPPALGA